jgi:hypothetical protein
VEIVHDILLPLSSSDLFSAGLVSRTFQAEAERLLYRSIGYRMRPKRLLPCLDTIVAVKSKAVLVKSLNICFYRKSASIPAITERLSVCLPKMTALTSLRLRILVDISEEQRISLVKSLQYAASLQHYPKCRAQFFDTLLDALPSHSLVSMHLEILALLFQSRRA